MKQSKSLMFVPKIKTNGYYFYNQMSEETKKFFKGPYKKHYRYTAFFYELKREWENMELFIKEITRPYPHSPIWTKAIMGCNDEEIVNNINDSSFIQKLKAFDLQQIQHQKTVKWSEIQHTI
ncbi:MAG: hypothetical protein HGB12_12625 [Bacteroidetes bacterium]|nr:hypothetical protein [Bacteroidota bacterium]